MPQTDAVSFQSEVCLKEPNDTEADLIAKWSAAEAGVRALPPLLSYDAQPQPLTAAAQIVADRVSKLPVFVKTFGIAPPAFANVRLDALVSAQKYVDVEHVETLQPPPENDEAAVLEFCMRANPIDPPLMAPDGGITFSSHYAQNLLPSGLSFRIVDDHEVEVVATIISRPNFVQVVNFNGRFMIANGYHRAVALIRAGHSRMPCLVRPIPNLEAVGLVPPGFFDLSRLLAARPPLAGDFFSALGSRLNLRARNHILRVGFQVNAFEAPR